MRGQNAKGSEAAQAIKLGQHWRYVRVCDVAIVGNARHFNPVVAYGAALVVAVTWPFLMPGQAFALRDMLVFDGMYLTRASLGFGDLPARNVPQDALLAIVPYPVLALRVIMVAAACCAAVSAYRLGRSPFGKAAAMTVLLWNPFVVERLLQGQWSLVVAAWLLPTVFCAPVPLRVLAHWLASLTPTGALAAAAFSRGWRGVLVSVVTCAPWVVASVVAGHGGTSSVAAVAAFAPRAEAFVGTLGSLMGLGGIWNGAAVPWSREVGFALFGLLLLPLLALGWRGVPRRWLWLAALGLAIPLAAWAGLTAPLVQHLPGGGLLRDSTKFLLLTLPACTAAAGHLSGRCAATAVGVAFLQVPDASLALSALAPTTVAVPAVDHKGRDVFFENAPTLLLTDAHTPTLNPAPKAMNVVESGALSVDGVEVDPPSARWVAASDAVGSGGAAGSLDLLRDLGVGLVVYEDGSVLDTGAPARGLPPLGVALFALWCAVPLLGTTKRDQDHISNHFSPDLHI